MYNCEKCPEEHECVFYINFDGKALMEIYTKNEFKRFIIISLEFVALPDAAIRSSIAFRYSAMRSKVDILESRVVDVVELVKRKNPSLGVILKNFALNKDTF